MPILGSLCLLLVAGASIFIMLGSTARARQVFLFAFLIALGDKLVWPWLSETLHGVSGEPAAVLLLGAALAGVGFVLWHRRGMPRERRLPRERALPPPPRFEAEEQPWNS